MSPYYSITYGTTEVVPFQSGDLFKSSLDSVMPLVPCIIHNFG